MNALLFALRSIVVMIWPGRERLAAPVLTGHCSRSFLPQKGDLVLHWLASGPPPARFFCSPNGRCLPPPPACERLMAWLRPGRSRRTRRRFFLLLVNGVLRAV